MDVSTAAARIPGAVRGEVGGASQISKDGAIGAVREGVDAGLELLVRLREMNVKLRGPAATENSAKEAPRANDLSTHVADLHQVLKACHAELSEAFNVLGI